MLQIRITNSDGSNSIILEEAENISYSKSVNLSEESISFEIAKNLPKASVLNPDVAGYKMFWEAWDTTTNKRKNRGPLTSIAENGPNWKVEGSGRSALLADYSKSLKTFYAKIDVVLDGLRYENVAIQPRTTTIVNSVGAEAIIGTVTVDERFEGLSKATKDNAIDDDNGYIKPGQIEPPNTYYTTNSFWAGMSKRDTLVVDLGGTYHLSKLSLIFPNWGGAHKLNNRTYDFAIDYANEDTVSPAITYKQRQLTDWTNLYTSPDDNRISAGPTTPRTFYIGTITSGASLDPGTVYVAQSIPGPLDARYFRVRIRDVHAWYGTIFDAAGPHDGYSFQCDPNYSPGDDSHFGSTHGIMENKVFNERELEPSNDCFASITEFGAFQEIIPRNEIKPLALQRIDDNNLQISYYHIPDASETITTDNGFRKFEPGGFFRKFTLNYSGASSSFTKFFDTDCANCFPDGHNFAIMDQNSTLIYATDSTSGSGISLKTPAYTSSILMKGASNATVTYVDSWPAVTDPFSWGTSYSYSEKANDYVTIHFRGESLKWYATVPADKTGATVKIEIRQKAAPSFSNPNGWSTNTWGSYSTLENSFTLPNDIASEVVYEIPFGSGILQRDIVYEIKITNLDGNYCSVDSFEGYWSGSIQTLNEDSNLIHLSDVTKFVQIYDKRFSGGSMYKITKPARIAFAFNGDRCILYGAKSAHAGILSLALIKLGYNGTVYDDNNDSKVNIPGSDSNRILEVNLRTGKVGNEITQAVLFDTNDYFPGGLPWDNYELSVHYRKENLDTYNGIDTEIQDSFTPRCTDCNPPTGDTVAITRPVYIDGIAAHTVVGLSLSFDNENHLEIAKSVIQALQLEGDVSEEGLLITPRLGEDTNEVLREGHNTLVDFSIVNDVSQIASMLVSNGSDIDGLPLFTITEDKKTREDLGRTVMRKEDFRDIADYFQLIGLSRTSLRKRKKPEKRITVTHIAKNLELNQGDSFILYTKKQGPLRVRINRKTISQTSSGGTTYTLECIRWPEIV